MSPVKIHYIVLTGKKVKDGTNPIEQKKESALADRSAGADHFL